MSGFEADVMALEAEEQAAEQGQARVVGPKSEELGEGEGSLIQLGGCSHTGEAGAAWWAEVFVWSPGGPDGDACVRGAYVTAGAMPACWADNVCVVACCKAVSGRAPGLALLQVTVMASSALVCL